MRELRSKLSNHRSAKIPFEYYYTNYYFSPTEPKIKKKSKPVNISPLWPRNHYSQTNRLVNQVARLNPKKPFLERSKMKIRPVPIQ